MKATKMIPILGYNVKVTKIVPRLLTKSRYQNNFLPCNIMKLTKTMTYFAT